MDDRAKELYELTETEGLTLREAGERVGLSHERVREILHEAGYHVRTRKEARANRRKKLAA